MSAKQIAERLREQAACVDLLHPLEISPEDVAARYREAEYPCADSYPSQARNLALATQSNPARAALENSNG